MLEDKEPICKGKSDLKRGGKTFLEKQLRRGSSQKGRISVLFVSLK